MLTGSIPPTGIPMPFISAGGTSLSVFMGAMGILVNVGQPKQGGEILNKIKSNIKVISKREDKVDIT